MGTRLLAHAIKESRSGSLLRFDHERVQYEKQSVVGNDIALRSVPAPDGFVRLTYSTVRLAGQR